MNVPSFLIIGAPKSGTTSLHYYMAEHPQVYVSSMVKEARYFAYDSDNADHRAKAGCAFPVTTWEQYVALFTDASGFKAIGESSPQYLGCRVAAQRIATRLPDVKLVVVLRNPVDRTVSAFIQDVRNKQAKLSELSGERLSSSRWARGSFYRDDLKRYYDLFSREQIKVIRFKDLKSDTNSIVREVYDFLGVDSTFSPDTSIRHNKGGLPSNPALDRMLRSLRNSGIKRTLKPFLPASVRRLYTSLLENNLVAREVLTADQKRIAIKDFRDDILETEELVGMELSDWFEGAP